MPPTRRTFSLVPLLAALLLVAGGCGGDSASTGSTTAEAEEARSEGERLEVPDSGEAVVWGEGTYGVVLAHGASFDAASWGEQAAEIADEGFVVLAVEDIAPESILAAADYLRSDGGADRGVAIIGASAGADATLDALATEPEAADGLITLSANGFVAGIGSEPKLFIASEDEPVADVSTQLADESDGSDNEVLLLSGSAHAQAIFEGDEGERALTAIEERLAGLTG